jgi:hypothetical protein
VVSFLRPVAALAAVLTLCIGNLAVCAGWQATAEARMACCMNGASCPMHRSESHHSRSTRAVSQAQADNCCAAASNRHTPTAPIASYASSDVLALMPVAVTVSASPALLARQAWRVLVPLPVSAVPKHLLLSVLLV